MSIPADFRRVLDESDPDRPSNKTTRMFLIHGSHLKDHLDAYTPQAMDEIMEMIDALPRGSRKKKTVSRFILSKSQEVEIDKDGRIVMPKERRAQLGLDEIAGQIMMVGMGEYFEVWNKDVYDAKEAQIDASFMEEDEDYFDPLELLYEDHG